MTEPAAGHPFIERYTPTPPKSVKSTLAWMQENIKPITFDDLLRLASKGEAPVAPLPPEPEEA